MTKPVEAPPLDWLTPRPVGFSDGCLPFGSIFELDWSKPYIHYGVTPDEAERGLRVQVGMSFDDDGVGDERRWYLVAIIVWDEWPWPYSQ